MAQPLYTKAGLEKLAQIILQAMADKTPRAFAEQVNDGVAEGEGISYNTIRRLIKCETLNPSDQTLALIALQTDYSFEELKAIAQERTPKDLRKYRVAEDLFADAQKLSESERKRLINMLVLSLPKSDKARLLQILAELVVIDTSVPAN